MSTIHTCFTNHSEDENLNLVIRLFLPLRASTSKKGEIHQTNIFLNYYYTKFKELQLPFAVARPLTKPAQVYILRTVVELC